MASVPPTPQSPPVRRPSASVTSPANAQSSAVSRQTSVFPAPSPNTVSTDEPQMPVRHPRPLTAAELHHELEKEQEAVVNRLQRELSQLRAQTASVASNTSSVSSSTSAVFDSGPADLTTPSSLYPTTSRRHRSSSSYSTRSLSISAHPPGLAERSSQASVDRARDAGMIVPGGGSRSRQNSHSVTLAPPAMSSSITMPAPHRASLSRQASDRPSPGFGHGSGGQYFSGQVGQALQSFDSNKYDDAQQAKAALDVARRDNEKLVARVRELEAKLKEKEKQKLVVASET